MRGICSLGDGKPAKGRGLCSMHWSRWKRHGDPLFTKVIFGDDEARFESKVDRSGGPDSCHPYTGPINKSGYGDITVRRKTVKAHSYAYVRAYGPVPEGFEIDHRCHDPEICHLGSECPHRRCCNPRHLLAVTHRVNSYRSNATKVSDADIATLYRRWTEGETQRDLAQSAGIDFTALQARFRRHVKEHPDEAPHRILRKEAAMGVARMTVDGSLHLSALADAIDWRESLLATHDAPVTDPGVACCTPAARCEAYQQAVAVLKRYRRAFGGAVGARQRRAERNAASRPDPTCVGGH